MVSGSLSGTDAAVALASDSSDDWLPVLLADTERSRPDSEMLLDSSRFNGDDPRDCNGQSWNGACVSCTPSRAAWLGQEQRWVWWV